MEYGRVRGGMLPVTGATIMVGGIGVSLVQMIAFALVLIVLGVALTVRFGFRPGKPVGAR